MTSDALGNRLTFGSQTYTWDELNRMTSNTTGSLTTNYAYRADGMRVSKTTGRNYTNYFYDGQMTFADVDDAWTGQVSVSTETDYAIGARGIDAIFKNGATAYPINDAHGNMVSTLSKVGSTYQLSNQGSYDPWGAIRLGNTAGDPKGRYCANLGHKQDDESGLIYMRARYYEPTSGRFLSEDPIQNGLNWCSYCSNDPVGGADKDGRFGENQSANAIWMWAIGMVLDQMDRLGVDVPSGWGRASKDLIQYSLLTAGALEMGSSFIAAGGATMLVGLESGSSPIMFAAAGAYAVGALCYVVASAYAYEGALAIDMDIIDSGD